MSVRRNLVWIFDYVCMNFVTKGKKNAVTSSEVQLLEEWFSHWKSLSVWTNSLPWLRNVKQETLVSCEVSLNIVTGWRFVWTSRAEVVVFIGIVLESNCSYSTHQHGESLLNHVAGDKPAGITPLGEKSKRDSKRYHSKRVTGQIAHTCSLRRKQLVLSHQGLCWR